MLVSPISQGGARSDARRSEAGSQAKSRRPMWTSGTSIGHRFDGPGVSSQRIVFVVD